MLLRPSLAVWSVLVIGCATLNPPPPPPQSTEIIGSIQDKALNYVRTTNWAPGPSLRHLATGFWCNIFVADVLTEAGAATWEPIREPLGVSPTRPPVAAEWANPGFAIRGWSVIYPTSATTALSATQI